MSLVPVSPLPGHSDDCAACRWAELPDEDRAALDEAAFRTHTRCEPPKPPAPLRDLRVLAAAVGAVAMFGIAAIVGMPLIALAGVVALIGAAILGYRLKDEQRRVEDEWHEQVQVWKAGQTEAWLAARASAQLWPCPTCGSLSCSNNHSVTKTVHGPAGVSRSRTDPT